MVGFAQAGSRAVRQGKLPAGKSPLEDALARLGGAGAGGKRAAGGTKPRAAPKARPAQAAPRRKVAQPVVGKAALKKAKAEAAKAEAALKKAKAKAGKSALGRQTKAKIDQLARTAPARQAKAKLDAATISVKARRGKPARKTPTKATMKASLKEPSPRRARAGSRAFIKDKGKLAEPTVSLSTEERRELKENRARAALAKELQSVESSRVPPGAPRSVPPGAPLAPPASAKARRATFLKAVKVKPQGLGKAAAAADPSPKGAAAVGTRRVGTGVQKSRRALGKPAPPPVVPEGTVKAKARGVAERPRPPQTAAFSTKVVSSDAASANAAAAEPEQTLGRRERPPPPGIRYLKIDLGRDGGNIFTATIILLGYTLYLIGGRGIFGEMARNDTPEDAFATAEAGVAYSDQQRKVIAAKSGQPVGINVEAAAPPVKVQNSANGTSPTRRTTRLPSKRERSRAVLQTQRKVKGQAIKRVAESKANNRRVKTSALLGKRRAEKRKQESARRARKRAAKTKAVQVQRQQKSELERRTREANKRRLRAAGRPV